MKYKGSDQSRYATDFAHNAGRNLRQRLTLTTALAGISVVLIVGGTLSPARAADVWTGTSSSDWFTASNWQANTLPVTSDDIWLDAITLNPTTVTAATPTLGSFYIGNSGQGALTVSNVGSINDNSGYVGFSAGSNGAATITGAGATWTNLTVLIVGNDGTGTLTVADGGVVSATAISIANAAGSTGTLNIGGGLDGGGHPLTALAAGTLNTPTITFGAGTGSINFNHTGNPDGSDYFFAPVISGFGTISQFAGTTVLTGDSSSFTGPTNVSGGELRVNGRLGSGTVLVGGSGFSFNGSTIGNTDAGSGLLTISNGGQLTNGAGSFFDTFIGLGARSIGNAAITGTGSSWNSTDSVFVGISGATGSLTLDDHSAAQFGALMVGGNLTDTTGVLVNNDFGSSHGTLSVTGGSHLTADYFVDTGVGRDAVGEVTISGTGSVLSSAGMFIAGALGGHGVLAIENGGVLSTGANGPYAFSVIGAGGPSNGGVGPPINGGVGEATISGAGSQWINSGGLYVGGFVDAGSGIAYPGTGTLLVSDGATLSSAGDHTTNLPDGIGFGTGAIGTVTLTGVNTRWTASQNIAVGLAGGIGTLFVQSGATLDVGYIFGVGIGIGGFSGGGGTLNVLDGGAVITNSLGDAATGGGIVGAAGVPGTVNISGNRSSWTINGALFVGGQPDLGLDPGTGTVNIQNAGVLSASSGITLAPDVGSVGVLNIGAAPGSTPAATGMLDTPTVTFGAGTGTINFNHTGNPDGSAYVFAPVISGAGTINQFAGTTVLTGESAGFTGSTNVAGGELRVDGRLGSGAFLVAAGATLSGSGTIGGPVTVNGTLAAGKSPGTLTVGSLTLGAGSTSLFQLNTLGITGDPNPPTGNDLVNVTGNLTLGGTLNTEVPAGGYYRLFNYGGTLAGAFGNLSATSTTPGFTVASQNVETIIPGQVNLSVLGAGQMLFFWDGNDSSGNNGVNGGTGTWSTANTNWTGMPGNAGINGSWGGSVGVFAGAVGGPINVSGTQSFDTLQFSTNGYLLNGGTLALAPAAGTAAAVNVDSGIGVTIDSTVANGSGNTLVKVGGGSLTLRGTNTYTGGTQVQAGTLIGNAGSIRGDIANAGTVVFDQPAAATFGSDIAGLSGVQGLMVKQGAGTLTLTGGSSLDWTVNAGGLVSSANRFTGNATLGTGTSITFDESANSIYAGTISGSGDLSKTGLGVLTLNGQNTYTGTTTVSGGKLVVGDDVHSGASLAGIVTVAPGAALGGRGMIGGLLASGTVAPGNSIGTLTVNGNVTFAAGSIYAVEVDPSGSASDLIHATGTAQINGGTVQYSGLGGAYAPVRTYTILTADGGVTGTFDSVGSDYAFLSAALGYDANNVTLTLSRNDTAFAAVAKTPNQRGVAGGAQSLGFGNAVYNALVPLNADAARAAFDQLSGEVHASIKTAMVDDSQIVRDAATSRLRGALDVDRPGAQSGPTDDEGGSHPAAAASDQFATWGEAFGSWGTTNDDGNAAGLDHNTGGFLVGADGPLLDTWRLGFLTGYSRSGFDVDERGSSGDSDNYYLGIYGGRRWGALTISAGAAYTLHVIDTSRSVVLSGLADELSAKYHASTEQVFGELGYSLTAGRFALEPFANLARVSLNTSGFAETGGASALSVNADTIDTTFSTLGVHAATGFAVGTMTATARGTLGWRRAYGDVTPISASAFGGGDFFAVSGVSVARDAAVIGAGFDFGLTEHTAIGVSYNGQFGDNVRQQGFNAKLSVQF